MRFFSTCRRWLEEGIVLELANVTNITLIPKCDSPRAMQDWHPISLCNVVYKLVSKVLANRLKVDLGKCISEVQSAFVPERSILDNALIAIEVVHFMKSKVGKEGDVALKLDMRKAYDRIDWEYLGDVTLKMGFAER